jgi:hypothetical protein
MVVANQRGCGWGLTTTSDFPVKERTGRVRSCHVVGVISRARRVVSRDSSCSSLPGSWDGSLPCRGASASRYFVAGRNTFNHHRAAFLPSLLLLIGGVVVRVVGHGSHRRQRAFRAPHLIPLSRVPAQCQQRNRPGHAGIGRNRRGSSSWRAIEPPLPGPPLLRVWRHIRIRRSCCGCRLRRRRGRPWLNGTHARENNTYCRRARASLLSWHPGGKYLGRGSVSAWPLCHRWLRMLLG